jgi:hypothetical protein
LVGEGKLSLFDIVQRRLQLTPFRDAASCNKMQRAETGRYSNSYSLCIVTVPGAIVTRPRLRAGLDGQLGGRGQGAAHFPARTRRAITSATPPRVAIGLRRVGGRAPRLGVAGRRRFPPDGRSLTPICATRPLVTAPAAVRCGLARTRAFESVSGRRRDRASGVRPDRRRPAPSRCRAMGHLGLSSA